MDRTMTVKIPDILSIEEAIEFRRYCIECLGQDSHDMTDLEQRKAYASWQVSIQAEDQSHD